MCPGFMAILWQDEETGIYNVMGEFASFFVDAYSRHDTEPIVGRCEYNEPNFLVILQLGCLVIPLRHRFMRYIAGVEITVGIKAR